MTTDWKNKLYFGDNLKIMREYIQNESVDLIYLDPPFNSKATYNILFEEKNGTQSRAQIKAFEDTWHWGLEAELAYREITEKGPRKLVDLIGALRQFLGTNDMMTYLVMMAIRLVEMHRVLKPTGSIYLHCDPKASHYLKLVMDAVFDTKNFRNEIVWCYEDIGGRSVNYFKRKHDIIFFYQKTQDRNTFNIQHKPLSESTLKRYGPYFDDNEQITYRHLKETNPGVLAKLKGIPAKNLSAIQGERACYFSDTERQRAEQEKIAKKAQQMLDLHKELRATSVNTDKHNALKRGIKKLDHDVDEVI